MMMLAVCFIYVVLKRQPIMKREYTSKCTGLRSVGEKYERLISAPYKQLSNDGGCL